MKYAPEKIVYFVRHGQSEANTLPSFQGPDSLLTEKGKIQAEKIAERISRISFDALFSSPWPRAKATAEAIARATNTTPEFVDLFVERVKPEIMHGKSYDDESIKELWLAWEDSLYATGKRVPGGEGFDDLVARADTALEYLHVRPESSLVVVTHGFFLRVMVARVLLGDTLTPDAFKQFILGSDHENTGLTVLRYAETYNRGVIEKRWRLWTYNDHAHLG